MLTSSASGKALPQSKTDPRSSRRPRRTRQTLRRNDEFRVVCLGGSAGGLQAYMEILRNLPADTGMAFVVAPHRAVAHAHLLPHLLSTVTKMPVAEVKQGRRLEPNQVFVMPPHTDMTLAGNAFNLRTASRPPGWPKTINIFLCSLAEMAGPRAVAVILSGLDGDGSACLKAIKAGGGVTFAQSDASYPSMPDTAVETGHIDYLLPAADIAKALSVLAHEPLPAG
jgi:two-component system CheB/CheR fusion protein